MRQTIRTLTIILLLGLGIYGVKHHLPQAFVRSKAPVVRQSGYKINHAAIQRAKMFTVLISVDGFGGISRGTGILLDSTHVLTCAHVVEDSNDRVISVFLYPGYFVTKAKPVYFDYSKDLVVLEIDVKVNGAPKPAFQAAFFEGEPITIVGNILGAMKWFVSYGIISGSDGRDLLTDGLMLGGDSGGPWLNDRGEIVALSDWGLEINGHEVGINGGISAKTIKQFLHNLGLYRKDMRKQR